MSQSQLLLIGGLISLVSVIITQLISHTLSRRRDKERWQREEVRRLEEEVRRLEDLNREQIREQKKELAELESKKAELEATWLEFAAGKIILMNQRRDMVLGFNQDEMNRRAIAMRTILSEMNIDELQAIAFEKKPLPEIPGRPRELHK